MLEISRKIIIQAFKVNQVDLALALNQLHFASGTTCRNSVGESFNFRGKA
jgi:hypothetical protein